MLKMLIIGRLGKDAEIRTTQGGKSVINFSVAHSENYTDNKGQKCEKTIWCDCSWWTENHNIVPYLKKGGLIYIEGIPEIKTFQRQDGTTANSFGIRVMSCQLLSSSSNNNGQTNTNNNSQSKASDNNNHTSQDGYKPVQTASDNDDLPF